MVTKKITLNELRNLVKQIIKEEIEKEDLNQNNDNFWFTKESEDAEVYFDGIVLGEQKEEGSGDYIITENGDVFKFTYGANNLNKNPYLNYIKKIKIKEFPDDDNIKIGNKIFSPLGYATIYKLKNGKYYWEY